VPGEKFYLRTIPQRFVVAEDERQYKLMSKLQYRYTGPHTVLEEINPVVFRANVNGVVRTVHANKMKRAVPRPKEQGVQQPRAQQRERNRQHPVEDIDMEIDDRVESDDDDEHDQSEASTIMSNEEYEWDELAPANGWDQLAPIPDIAIEDEVYDEIGQPVSLIAETVQIAPEQTPPATNIIIPNKVVNIDPSPMNQIFRALPARPIIQLAPTP